MKETQMTVVDFINRLNDTPSAVEFADVIAVIEEYYAFEPTAFQNGNLQNQAGENSGSCKIFSFAKLHGLSEEQTLACFGHYYRDDVLGNPAGSDHGNIRNFMQTGWQGIEFSGQALTAKA
jgi:hypothetical protein